MAVSFDSYLGGLDDALVLRGRRSEIIASNIANADTPGYKAKDIDFKSAMSNAMGTGSEFKKDSLKMATTDSKHIKMSQGAFSNDVMYRNPYQPSLDGNTVDSGVEKTEFTKNSVHYSATLRFLTGKFQGLTKAIKGQ
ncbi:MAG: flagellar basal body rod protein FlgB [Gammaproteobacteria bacterium]|nr:flagellar basal body rod protein FlgB [Gammaproteobacteria bacterium]